LPLTPVCTKNPFSKLDLKLRNIAVFFFKEQKNVEQREGCGGTTQVVP